MQWFFNAQYSIAWTTEYATYIQKGPHIALSADGFVKPFSFLPLALLQPKSFLRKIQNYAGKKIVLLYGFQILNLEVVVFPSKFKV